MLDIFNTFLKQDNTWFEENSKYLIDFVSALQSVKPFELACDFLMDEEKEVIQKMVNRI